MNLGCQQSDLNTQALNRQLVKDVFTAIDKRDYDQLQALWPEDMKCFIAGLPEPMSRNETIEFISNWYTIFPDYTHEIHEVVADGNKVMIRVTNHTTHQNKFEGLAPTGKKVDYEAVHMVTIEGDAISEWWLLEDDLSFRSQLGMELVPTEDNG